MMSLQEKEYRAGSGPVLAHYCMFTAELYTGGSHANIPDSKVHGANMGPIWGRQDPGGLHVGPMNFAIWDGTIQGLF